MIEDLMNIRSSVRFYAPYDVEDAIVLELLDAARKSPSGNNEQQYVFGIVRDRDRIGAIADASYGQNWIRCAPLVIALCTKIKEDSKGARAIQMQRFPCFESEIAGMDKLLYTCLNLEEHQTKIPGTVMMLAALERGIHSTWISRYDVLRVRSLLGLPENMLPSELIAFGYPKGPIMPLKKKNLDELVFRETWPASARAESRPGVNIQDK